jgi:replicative DNA helicase
VVLGGDTSSGKSALALAIALRASAAGNSVIFFSGEMSPARIAERALAMEARVSVDELRRGSKAPQVREAAARLENCLPRLLAMPSGSLGRVAMTIRKERPALAILDPLTHLRGAAAEQPMASAVPHLKDLARRTGTTVVAVAPLAASPRGRADRRPTLDDFGSCGLRDHADLLLGLFREELYERDPHIKGATELHVLKNRSGPAGSFADLFFFSEWLRFEDVLEPES